MLNIALIDYGIGNIGSLVAAFRRLDSDPWVWSGGTAAPQEMRQLQTGQVDLVVLPGVGSLSHATQALQTLGLWDVVLESQQRQYPLVGICLGLQLFFGSGDEGGEGLGLIAGSVPRLKHPRLPHIGWNTVESPAHLPPTPLLDSPVAPWFYFVHSYHVAPEDPATVVGITPYGSAEQPYFPAIVAHRQLLGMQFHPELSGPAGHRILQRILEEVQHHGSLAGLGPV